MKVDLLAQTDSGGAGRAAVRLAEALQKEGVDSSLLVSRKRSNNPNVRLPIRHASTFASTIATRLDHLPTLGDPRRNEQLLSVGWLTNPVTLRAIRSSVDVVNLHWVNKGMLAIGDVPRIQKPVIWTLHDMWALGGAQHYFADEGEALMMNGARWFRSLDQVSFDRKRTHWREPCHVVTPSRWLALHVSRSLIMADWPVHVIPNAVPTSIFRPHPRSDARLQLGLPQDVPIVAFGADKALDDHRKGWDLLKQSLTYLESRRAHRFVLAVFGNETQEETDFATVWFGRIDSDEWLALLLSAADIVAVPSRIENLPQVATEAQACGTPVVAFDVGGMRDAVVDAETGILIQPFDTDAFGDAIWSLLVDEAMRASMAGEATARARRLWSHGAVARRYINVFEQAADS